MTDAQIEAVARLYCRKLGLDPDEMINGIPLWKHHRSTVRIHALPSALAMSEAIAEVLGEKGAG